jgi:hypothetical protein
MRELRTRNHQNSLPEAKRCDRLTVNASLCQRWRNMQGLVHGRKAASLMTWNRLLTLNFRDGERRVRLSGSANHVVQPYESPSPTRLTRSRDKPNR